MSKELIVAYTEFEGGPWLSTEGAPLLLRQVPPDSYLNSKIGKNDGKVCQMMYFLLHSFRTNEDRRWDCLSGWSKKPASWVLPA